MESLVQAIIELGKSLNINMSIAGQGVDKEQFEEVVGVLAERAFEDQCTTANPKLPLISELKEIYMEAYKGGHDKKSRSKSGSFIGKHLPEWLYLLVFQFHRI